MKASEFLQPEKFQGHDNEDINLNTLFDFLDKNNLIDEFHYFNDVFTTCKCGSNDDWSMLDCHVLIDTDNGEIQIDDESEDDNFEQFDLQVFICECGRWGTYIR